MVAQAPHLRATMPAGTQVRFRPAVVSRSSPHLFTPPHFLSKILHCPIQIKAKKPINKSLKKKRNCLQTNQCHVAEGQRERERERKGGGRERERMAARGWQNGGREKEWQKEGV